MIRVTCPSCAAVFRAKDEHAGRRGKCPRCGSVVQVPDASQIVPDPEPPAPAEPRPEADAPTAPVRKAPAKAPARKAAARPTREPASEAPTPSAPAPAPTPTPTSAPTPAPTPAPAAAGRGRRGRGGKRRYSVRTGATGEGAIEAGARLAGARVGGVRKIKRGGSSSTWVALALVAVVAAGGVWAVMKFTSDATVSGLFAEADELRKAARYEEALATLKRIQPGEAMFDQAQQAIADVEGEIRAQQKREQERQSGGLYRYITGFDQNQVQHLDPAQPDYEATIRYLLVRAREFLERFPDDERAPEIQALFSKYGSIVSLEAPPSDWDTSVEVKFRLASRHFAKAWQAIEAFDPRTENDDALVTNLRKDVQRAALDDWKMVFEDLQARALQEGDENWRSVQLRTRRFLDSVEGVPGVSAEARHWHDLATQRLGG